MITWKDISGHFGEDQRKYYEMVVPLLPQGARVVEVGCFMGKSTSHLAQLAREDVEIYCVDLPGDRSDQVNVVKNASDVFEENMRNAGVWDRLCVINHPSPDAAGFFDDGSLDFVFIDGDHSYESVRADVEGWWPKVKAGGGIMAGDDWSAGKGWPGIKKAVKEFVREKDLVSVFKLYGRQWQVTRV